MSQKWRVNNLCDFCSGETSIAISNNAYVDVIKLKNRT